MVSEVIEDGCSSATFAPSGTTVGETHIEQQEASLRDRNEGVSRERSNALGERVKRRWVVHDIITEGRAVARPTAATYRCPRQQTYSKSALVLRSCCDLVLIRIRARGVTDRIRLEKRRKDW